MTTHPRKPLRTVAAWAATAAILTLAGCGGGGDGGSWNGAGNNGAGGGTIPASALQNGDNFIAYVKQVVANRLDTSEPIELGDVVAPKSDTAEAVGI
jgi:hypothetical protein